MHISKLSRLLHEPLVQFLLIGIVIFGVDSYVLENTENPRQIVIDDARYKELVSIFADGKGRSPTDRELDELIIKWSQNEILFREARVMGLDKGDEMIRQRLILKMRNILFSSLTTETPDREVLKAWFENNRNAYDRPPLYDFEQFPLTGKVSSSETKEAAMSLAVKLGQASHPDEYDNLIRRYSKRPDFNLFSVFGSDHGQQLINSPDLTWVAVSSDQGWHLARITRRYPGEAVEFDKVYSKVAKDWKTETSRQELSRAVQEIAEQYELKLEFEEQSLPEETVQQSTVQHVSENVVQ